MFWGGFDSENRGEIRTEDRLQRAEFLTASTTMYGRSALGYGKFPQILNQKNPYRSPAPSAQDVFESCVFAGGIYLVLAQKSDDG